jgi:hypothetical protein
MAQDASRFDRKTQYFSKHPMTVCVKIGAADPACPYSQQDLTLFERWLFYLFEPDVPRSAEYGCFHDLLSDPMQEGARGYSHPLCQR